MQFQIHQQKIKPANIYWIFMHKYVFVLRAKSCDLQINCSFSKFSLMLNTHSTYVSQVLNSKNQDNPLTSKLHIHNILPFIPMQLHPRWSPTFMRAEIPNLFWHTYIHTIFFKNGLYNLILHNLHLIICSNNPLF